MHDNSLTKLTMEEQRWDVKLIGAVNWVSPTQLNSIHFIISSTNNLVQKVWWHSMLDDLLYSIPLVKNNRKLIRWMMDRKMSSQGVTRNGGNLTHESKA